MDKCVRDERLIYFLAEAALTTCLTIFASSTRKARMILRRWKEAMDESQQMIDNLVIADTWSPPRDGDAGRNCPEARLCPATW
jgi:hypothetical protein